MLNLTINNIPVVDNPTNININKEIGNYEDDDEDPEILDEIDQYIALKKPNCDSNYISIYIFRCNRILEKFSIGKSKKAGL